MTQTATISADTLVPTFESLDEIGEALTRRGSALYGGEAVTQLAHALQCATLAEDAGCSQALITAALLHDLGHMAGQGDDEQSAHSELGARLLARVFGRNVTEPVRLHVNAKRYLCAVDSTYWGTLSEASKQSLVWQGGPYAADQAKRFISQPHADDAVRLRQWDDAAKVSGLATRSLAHFIEIARGVQVKHTRTE
ncbi:MAG: HD domain-containing protein [Herminiimonas sp.]|nr:HD domain-containing protein [Herminiimonas sp.]